MSGKQLDIAARELLSRYEPDHLRRPGKLDILSLADALEFGRERIVFGATNLEGGLEAFTDPVRREIVIDNDSVYRPALAGDGRARQTISHEIGHIMHITQVN